MVMAAMKLKDTCSLEETYDKPGQHVSSLEETYDKPGQHVRKQKHYFANKGLYSQMLP